MSEKEEAIRLANKVLDRPYADPDDDIAILARQFLRSLEVHPAISHVLKFFAYQHLPEKLQAVSKPFCDLAKEVAERAPDNQETTVALRKLLEAKDAAVRAVL